MFIDFGKSGFLRRRNHALMRGNQCTIRGALLRLMQLQAEWDGRLRARQSLHLLFPKNFSRSTCGTSVCAVRDPRPPAHRHRTRDIRRRALPVERRSPTFRSCAITVTTTTAITRATTT
jgi:hypothetical protein